MKESFIKVVAHLNKQLSRKYIERDLNSISNGLFIKIAAKLSKAATMQLLQNELKQLNNLYIQVGANLKTDDKTMGNLKKNIQTLQNSLTDLEIKLKISDQSAHSQLSAITSSLEANGTAAQTTASSWSGLVNLIKHLGSDGTMLATVLTQVFQSISSIMNLDTAMTQLYKTQKDITSYDQLSGLLKNWNKLSQELAVTTDSLIHSMIQWSANGFDLNLSEQLSKITVMLEKAASLSKEQAASTLLSTSQSFPEVNGFGEQEYVERAAAIGDKITAISSKYAISSEGVASALKTSSDALKHANNDLDESIALITAANNLFHSSEDASTILNVVSARIRGQKGELEKLGENTDGMLDSVSKVQEQILDLTNHKVNILEDDGETLKSTYQIIQDIGKELNHLSDKNISSLLQTMFGEEHLSSGASLLFNYEELEKIKADSMNASNAMADEYAKYMESAQAHTTRLKQKLIETYSTFMNGDMIKFSADVGSAILDFLNYTDLVRHGLLAIASIKIGTGIMNLGANFKKIRADISDSIQQMNLLGNSLRIIKSEPLSKGLKPELLEQLGENTKSLTDKNLKLLLSKKQLDYQDKLQILTSQGLEDAESQEKLTKLGLITATNTQSAANIQQAATTNLLKASWNSFKATITGVGASLKAAFLSNSVGIALMGITTIVSIATTKLSNHNEKLEKARKANMEAAHEAAEHAGKLSELYLQYKNLASIQNKTIEQEEQFKTITGDISKTLGDKAAVLNGLTAGTEEYTEALKNATKEELKSQLTTAKIGKKAAEDEVTSKTSNILGFSKVSVPIEFGSKNQNAALKEVGGILEDFKTLGTRGVMKWGPKDADKIDDVVTYYYALIEAREKLVNSENSEDLMSTNLYGEINSTIDELTENIENYQNQSYNYAKLDYLAKNGIPATREELDKMRESILHSSSAGKQFQSVLSGLFQEDFSTFSNLDLSVSAKTEDSNSLKDWSDEQLQQIEQVQSTITTLKDSLGKLKAGSLTITDVSKLLTDFPQLNSYVDITASNFGSLQEGLEQLIQTTPENLLNSLQALNPAAAEDKLALDNLISSIQLLSGLKPDLSMNGLLNTYDQISGKLTNLTDLQAALGSSFSLTAEEARKFGQLYPQLLSLGETSSDGLIRFNQDTVNHFIEGKQAEINADRQATLAQLEHRKSVITAQMGMAQMELALLQSKYNQEILAENQKNEAIAEASQNIAQYLLHLGTAQANADADSKEIMADNIIEYDRIVSEVASNLFSNLSGSSSDAGANVRLFSSSMIDNLQSVAEQAANTGKTIQSIGTGSIFTAAKKGLSQLPGMMKSFHPKSILKDFKKTLNDTLHIEDYMATQKEVKLRLDIEGYQKDLSEIDASIAMWESIGNTPLNLFGKNNSGASGGSGGFGGPGGAAASELDYVKQSIEQLREQMELLQVDIGQLSFSGQEERITGIITKYNELVGIYKQTRETAKQDWLLKSQGLSQEQKTAISSGSEFTPEQFDGQAQYNQITAAREAWISYQKSLKEVKIITDSLADDFVKLYQAMNETEDYQLKLLGLNRKKAENQISDAQAMNQTADPHSYEQLLSLSRQEEQYYEKKLGNAIRILEVTKENEQAYLKMQEEIQSCEDALYNCKKQQREWQKALLELPVKQLEQASEQLDKSLSKLNKSKDSKDSAISGAFDILDTQKEDLEKQLGSINQFYDGQIAALREANEERSRAIELEQAAADLEKAQTQKTKKVLKNGQWVWEADLEAIREAKQGYEELLLENQVEELEKKKELDTSSIQRQIEELEDYRKKWEEISSALETEQNRATLAAQYGLTLEQVKEQILNKNLDLVTQMTLGYQEIQAHITSLEQEKIRNEELMQTVQDYISQWQYGEIGIQEAKEAIEVLVEDNQIELDSMAQRRDSVAAYSGTWEAATEQIGLNLTGLNTTEAIAKDQEAEIMAMRLANLSAFQAGYQQSFTDMAAKFSLSMDAMAAKFAETAGQIEANALRISEAVTQAAQAREELSFAGKASKDLSHTSDGPIRVVNRDSNSGPGVEKHHSGVLAGYVGGNGQKEKLRLDALTKLSTQPLEHNEIPMIAREGEVLFTKSQQEMLLKNIGNLSISQPIIPKLDYRQLTPVIGNTNPGGNVNFNGDIIVQEVKNADGLAKAIKQQLPSITRQQIYSIK